MFSIIIPLYNKVRYVEKAIRSVMDQTYVEFELIVVDDGSTDGGMEIVRWIFAKENVHPEKFSVFEQLNQGVSTARNNGIKCAKYPYICLLDADDWWEPTFLEEMKELISAFPEAGIYGSSYYILKSKRQKLAPIGVDYEFNSGYINYYKTYSRTLCMPLMTGAVVIPQDIYNKVNGFDPKLKLGEDFDLWVRIAAKYPVAFLNKPLAYYNQDVDVNERAVGVKLYEPHEHMLFTTYSENLLSNPDFVFLYERLALYGLLPYYLNSKNMHETKKILLSIHWEWHETKYKIYYRFLPVNVLRFWFTLKTFLSKIKRQLIIRL